MKPEMDAGAYFNNLIAENASLKEALRESQGVSDELDKCRKELSTEKWENTELKRTISSW